MNRSLILETINKYSDLVMFHDDITKNTNAFNDKNRELFGLKINDTYILVILNRLLSSHIDQDIEDLLELDTYKAGVKVWIDKIENGAVYNLMLELINDTLDVGRLDRVLNNIDSIKLDSISNISTTDRMNNKWSVRVIGKNFIEDRDPRLY